MRKLIIAASALAIAAPAIAQPYPEPGYDPRDDEIVRSLPAPGEIEDMGDRVGDVADAILDTPVGPLREAVEGRRPARRGCRSSRRPLGPRPFRSAVEAQACWTAAAWG